MRPSASRTPASRPSRQPSPGRAIGSRSHACRSTPTSIDSKQAVQCSWWQDRAFWIAMHAYRLMAADSRLPPQRARGEMHNIWIAEADGSNPQQLTQGPGVNQGSPYWSPDGRRIAFDAEGEDAHRHLWMMDADGGAPRRLTAEAGDQVVPTWSHDARWIYYSWWQADTRDIWRVPPMAAPHSGSPTGRPAHSRASRRTAETYCSNRRTPIRR